MKSKILLLTGICFLFFSCSNELLDFQEGSIQSAAMSNVSNDCEPDIAKFELDLPETVTVVTVDPITYDPECNTAYFGLNISDGDLAGENITAWCVDIEGALDINQTVVYDVYSSTEDLSSLSSLFFYTDKFDEVNWLLNQSFIGKESGIAISETENYVYTFGHIQAAIWQLVDNKSCIGNGCDYLTCPVYEQWDQNGVDELMTQELVDVALTQDGFVPQCGQQIAVVLASKTNQSLIITVDVPEKEEECLDCEGNVTELTLQYNGTEEAFIEVKTKDEGVNGSKIVFEGNVGPGDQFTINGNDENGTFGDEIKVYVDGDYVKIKTDCSEAIGPGLIIEDIEVISGKSSNGAYLCPIPCDECKGKVTRLDLQYNGADKTIEIVQKKDGTEGTPLFSGPVSAGDEFTIYGQDDKGTLSTEIIITDASGTEIQRIHTSCSEPIGAGAVFGDFTVLGGASREGGELCPVDTPPGGGDDCNECEGKVTRLNLVYNGDNTAQIDVVQKKDNLIAFSNSVNPGDSFTFYGKDKKGTLGTEIIIYVDGFEAQRIHTSCSDPIGAGSVFGDFTVEGGASLNGGEFCPVDTPPTGGGDDCGECDGKVTRLELQYSGSGTDFIKIVQKKDGEIVFNETTDGNPIEIFGEWKKGTFGTELIIYVNGSEAQRIHTSCSVPIGVGSEFGDFTVLSGASYNGGEFCNPEGAS